VKHIDRVSKGLPASADTFQFIICEASRELGDLLEQKGGNLPLIGYINLKCDLPEDIQ